jgi:hypothetical protein
VAEGRVLEGPTKGERVIDLTDDRSLRNYLAGMSFIEKIKSRFGAAEPTTSDASDDRELIVLVNEARSTRERDRIVRLAQQRRSL